MEYGEMCFELKKYDEAEQRYYDAAEAWRKLGKGNKCGQAIYQMGISQMRAKKYDEASESFESSIKMFQLSMNPEQLAEFYLEVGKLEKKMGNKKYALYYFKESEKSFKKVKNTEKENEVKKLIAGINKSV